MSNRRYNQFRYSLEKNVTDIFARVTFGSSGAPTLDTPNAKGVVSVTRNSAGKYTFVFGTQSGMLDVYNKLLGARVVFNSGSSAPASPDMYIVANNVATAGTCSIQIQLTAPTGTSGAPTATDPASGEVGHFTFTFRNSNT